MISDPLNNFQCNLHPSESVEKISSYSINTFKYFLVVYFFFKLALSEGCANFTASPLIVPNFDSHLFSMYVKKLTFRFSDWISRKWISPFKNSIISTIRFLTYFSIKKLHFL